MRITELSGKLLSEKDASGALKQLATLTLTSISKDKEEPGTALENCTKFCRAAILARDFGSVSIVLKFILKANANDAWLLAASRLVLPCLNTMYCEILASSDPSKTESPGRLNVAISSKVRENKEALHALCGIFELCVDFCDIVTSATEKHLQIFIKSSAAVLFGSNFQTDKETLSATDYAMDELARFSSFALANVLLTYPAIVPAADGLLGKRVTGLLNYLFAAPELSIQKSLLLTLRILYDNACKTSASPRNLKARIENGLSATRFGNGTALGLFTSFDISDDDYGDKCERVISKLFETLPLESKCFRTDNCTVRMNGKVNGTTKKGGAQKAAVDWNKNSIVVHVRNQPAAYFPLHSITSMKWLSAHKEVRLTLKLGLEPQYTHVVVQFKAGCNRGYIGRAIEQRIQELLDLTGNAEEPTNNRKVSEITESAVEKSSSGEQGSELEDGDDEESIKGNEADDRGADDADVEEARQEVEDERLLEHNQEKQESCSPVDQETHTVFSDLDVYDALLGGEQQLSPSKTIKKTTAGTPGESPEAISKEGSTPLGPGGQKGCTDAFPPKGKNNDVSARNVRKKKHSIKDGAPETNDQHRNVTATENVKPLKTALAGPRTTCIVNVAEGLVQEVADVEMEDEDAFRNPITPIASVPNVRPLEVNASDEGDGKCIGDSDPSWKAGSELEADPGEFPLNGECARRGHVDVEMEEMEVAEMQGQADGPPNLGMRTSGEYKEQNDSAHTAVEVDLDDEGYSEAEEDPEVIAEAQVEAGAEVDAGLEPDADADTVEVVDLQSDRDEVNDFEAADSRRNAGGGEGDGEADYEGAKGRDWDMGDETANEKSFNGEDDRLRLKLLSAVRGVMKTRERRRTYLAGKVRNEVASLRAACSESDSRLLQAFAAAVRRAAGARRGQIRDFVARRGAALRSARGRVEVVHKQLLECRKRLKTIRAGGTREAETGHRGMHDMAKRLSKELQGCVGELRRKGGERKKSEEIFRGLAQLLGER